MFLSSQTGIMHAARELEAHVTMHEHNGGTGNRNSSTKGGGGAGNHEQNGQDGECLLLSLFDVEGAVVCGYDLSWTQKETLDCLWEIRSYL